METLRRNFPLRRKYGEVSHYGKNTAKCPNGEMSGRRTVHTANCPNGELSARRNVPTAKCPNGEMPHGELSHGEVSHGEVP